MPTDPFFEEFEKIREMFQKAMSGEDVAFGGTSQGISIKRVGDKTKIDIHGEVPEERIRKLKKKYPNAEITVNGQEKEGSRPVEVLDEEEPMDKPISEMDETEEETPPQKLALERFKEKQKEEEEEDS